MGPRNTWPKIPGLNLTFFFSPGNQWSYIFHPIYDWFFRPLQQGPYIPRTQMTLVWTCFGRVGRPSNRGHWGCR